MSPSATSLREAALAAARHGDVAGATRAFAAAAQAHPLDAALLNSAGNFHAGQRDHAGALRYFDRALTAQPDHAEAALNRAITLTALDRPGEALAQLAGAESRLAGQPRYWSVRAAAERATGALAPAAASYDRCLALEPGHVRALHGRARVALERGETTTVDRFAAALERSPGDAQLWLGQAMALDASGRTAEARQVAEALVAQAPGWTDALELLAQLRWAAGERESFCEHFVDAALRAPDSADLFRSRCRMLAGVEQFERAAAVAAAGRAQHPDDPGFALLEAIHAGEAGDDTRAGAIFATLDLATPARWAHEARHWLRLREPARAEALLARSLADEPGHVGAWALRDIAWRMLGDERHAWLHGKPGLVSMQPLDWPDADLAALVTLLDRLHDSAGQPVGQSVRDGTQTRGGLFDRGEVELERFERAIEAALERHRAGLPPEDPAHPLLRHRDAGWRISGSWSIRLQRAGRHTEHVHPDGLLSSAAYLVLPPPDLTHPDAGYLELGRPPPDLRLDLPPLVTLRPELGHCALFPSTLYHGTRPVTGGKRMTVAFDVGLANA